MKLIANFNPESRKRHWNKVAKDRKRNWSTTKPENSKQFSARYKERKLNLYLSELDDEIRTVIAS